MSPAFLRPRVRFKGTVRVERYAIKEMLSSGVRERPFVFCWSFVSVVLMGFWIPFFGF